MLEGIVAFLGALLISFLFTPVIRNLALKWKLFNYPDPRDHVTPVPYLGGVVILLGFLPFAVYYLAGTVGGAGLVTGIVAMTVLGLIDDLKVFSPTQKLTGQLVIVVLAYIVGLRFQHLGGSFFVWLVTIIWLVGITNAVNLIDIMDGLSAGVSSVAALGFAATLFLNHQTDAGYVALALAGSLLGFLRYNFNPAKVFMGDAGSLFIGFTLGGFGILLSNTGSNIRDIVFVPVLILGIPIFEVVFLSIVRTKKHRSIVQASRDHVAQRMLILDLSVRQIVLIAYLTGILLAANSVLTLKLSLKWVLLNLFVILILTVGFGWRIGTINMEDEGNNA